MDFLIKKAISSVLLPLPVAMCLIFIGLMLLWRMKRRCWPATLIGSGFFVLLLFSYGYVPHYLVSSLEHQYQPLIQPPNTISSIVVLGGGVRADTKNPPNTQLSAASLSRLIEAVRLYDFYKHHNVHVRLILSGGRVFGRPAESGVMQNTAEMLGVPAADIVLEAGSQDTQQEADYLKAALTGRHFILVTSATHMPRAMYLFQHDGLHPIAAPTQFLGGGSMMRFSQVIPSADSLVASDIAIHELLGRLWAMLW